MKSIKSILPVAVALYSSAVLSEVQLPHTPSETLTAQQISENLQVLADATSAVQTELSELQTIKSTPIFERMSASNEPITLLTHGSISVKAQCSFINGSEPSQGRGLALWTESSVEGTLAETSDFDDTYYGGEGAAAVAPWSARNTSDASSSYWDNRVNQGITVSTTGDTVLIDGETLSFGINVQGSDCLLTGNILSFTGATAPEDFMPPQPPIGEDR